MLLLSGYKLLPSAHKFCEKWNTGKEGMIRTRICIVSLSPAYLMQIIKVLLFCIILKYFDLCIFNSDEKNTDFNTVFMQNKK